MTAAATRVPVAGAGPGAGMASADAPPFLLPGEHFATALAWLVLGAAGLVLVAPDLAQGAFTAPRVVAVVHCFTLGWLTTAIFGALYQLFPVALGVPARSVRTGHVTFALLQAGTVAMVAGFWFWRPALLGAGWTLLCAATLLLYLNVITRRRNAPRGRIIGRYLAVAIGALGLALLVAGSRIGNLLGWWNVDALAMLAAHVHLAALGFVSLTAVGVGSRLVPMFLLSHGHAEWPLRWIGWLAGLGLLAFAAGELTGVPVAATLGAAAMAAGVALYLVLAVGYFRRRVRRVLDPGLSLAAAAHGFLALALLAGIALVLAPGFPLRLAAAYGVLGIMGWLVLFVAGIWQKIVPFLTWLHRFGPHVGEDNLPRVADLTIPAWGWACCWAFVAGVLVLAAAILAGSPVAARAGAVLFAAGAALLAAQGVRLGTLR